MSVTNPPALEARLESLPKFLHLKVGEGQWLLIAPPAVTSKEVSDALGITGAPFTSVALVLRVENYFGRNPTSTWEWITTKRGVELGTTQTPA